MRFTHLLRHAFGAAALTFVSVAQSATPGVVQGPMGWYEDIRFYSPATADVPVRQGTAITLSTVIGDFSAMRFQTATQGALMVDSWDRTAQWSTPIVQTLDPTYRGLGAGTNGIVDSNESMHLMFNSGAASRSVDLVGLELFFAVAPTNITLMFGELGKGLSLDQATLSTAGGLTRAQWWFAQPYTSSMGEFTLQVGQGSYYLGSVQVAAVPEPESIALLLAGVAVVGATTLRRRSA